MTNIKLPPFGKDYVYPLHLPNKDATDVAARFVAFCAAQGSKVVEVLLAAIEEYMANHTNEVY